MINQGKTLIVGFSGTVGGLVVSVESVTVIAQCIGAVCAAIVGVTTLALTIRKVLKDGKN